MRVLLTKFQGTKAFGVRCHLDGIRPAGDGKKWSGVSMDFFTQKVEQHKIMYIEKKVFYFLK